MFKSKHPTDLNILTFIYDSYYDEFCSYDEDKSIRAGKLYVPIDCQKIADHFGVNGDIIFGRLYYHLANKYKYQHGSDIEVKIFEFEIDGDPKMYAFPYLASIVSELKLEHKRYRNTLVASVIAVVVSVISLSITGYEKIVIKEINDKPNIELTKIITDKGRSSEQSELVIVED